MCCVEQHYDKKISMATTLAYDSIGFPLSFDTLLEMIVRGVYIVEFFLKLFCLKIQCYSEGLSYFMQDRWSYCMQDSFRKGKWSHYALGGQWVQKIRDAMKGESEGVKNVQILCDVPNKCLLVRKSGKVCKVYTHCNQVEDVAEHLSSLLKPLPMHNIV